MKFLGALIGVGIGFALATSVAGGSEIALALAVGFVVWLAFIAATLPARIAAFYEAPAQEAEVCPRCAAARRTPTGWCGPCTTELHAARLPVAEPVRRFMVAADEDDWPALRAVIGPQIATVLPTGNRFVFGRRAWICSLRTQGALVVGTNRHEAAYGDPRDHSMSWSRTHITLRRRLGGGKPIALTTVSRFTHDGSTISEMAQFAALPTSGLPAGTMSPPEPG